MQKIEANRTEPKGRARDPKKSFRVFYKRLSFLGFLFSCCYRTALIRHETCCAKSGLNSSKDSASSGSFFSEFSGWNRKKKILQKVEPVLVNQPIEGRANRDRDLEPKAEHFLECCDDALDGQKKRWGVRETEL